MLKVAEVEVAGAQEAEVEVEAVLEEPEVQAAAEEVEVVLEGPAEGRVPAGRVADQGRDHPGDRGLPGGRGNRPEEGRKPGNQCSSNSKSR